jgi:outer membrane protein assembly factor BamB
MNLGLKALKMPQRKVPLVDSLQEVGPEASEKDHKALSNFCAFDAATGKILWHTWMPQLTSNGAQTHRVDGFQFVVVAAQDTIYAFTLNP